MNIRNGILITMLVLLVACNGTSVKRRVRILDESITDYNVGLRWSMLNKIEEYHMHKDGEKPKMDREAMEDIRVTGYNIQDQVINDDVTEAVIKGEVDYYKTNSGTVKKLSFTHNWWFDEEKKRWFNESDFLELK